MPSSHLRTPALEQGYNHQNPLRTESPARAAEIDARIARAWEPHPRRFVIEPASNFLDKAAQALEILRAEMPECCKRHVIPALRDRRLQTDAVRPDAPSQPDPSKP
jgi:hypothetical protein